MRVWVSLRGIVLFNAYCESDWLSNFWNLKTQNPVLSTVVHAVNSFVMYLVFSEYLLADVYFCVNDSF